MGDNSKQGASDATGSSGGGGGGGGNSGSNTTFPWTADDPLGLNEGYNNPSSLNYVGANAGSDYGNGLDNLGQDAGLGQVSTVGTNYGYWGYNDPLYGGQTVRLGSDGNMYIVDQGGTLTPYPSTWKSGYEADYNAFRDDPEAAKKAAAITAAGLMAVTGGAGFAGSGGSAGATGLGGGGMTLADLAAIYGSYKSSAANQKASANGPVLPKDVQASRLALGDQFLRMILTPGGLDYGAPPFPINIGEGNDPYAAVDRYRMQSRNAYQDELTSALDTERAKLGGQYGIRFGTDLQRGLGDTVNRTTNAREAMLGQLGVSAYDAFMGRRMGELGTKLTDYRKQQYGLLPLVANYLGGQPASSPYSGGDPFGQMMQGFGNSMAQAPLYQHLNKNR